MLSEHNDNNVLTIYPVYIKSSVLNKHFSELKFRNLDKTDIPGVGLKVFNIVLGLFAGLKLYNPIFHRSFGLNINYLNDIVYPVKEIMNRGNLFLSNNFPKIDHRYVTYSISDFVNEHKDEFEPAENPFDKNGLTRIPYLKDTWLQVYIVSLCTEKELMAIGINHGYLVFSQNDAIQLCELICDNKFPPPTNYQEPQQFIDRLIDECDMDFESEFPEKIYTSSNLSFFSSSKTTGDNTEKNNSINIMNVTML